MIRNHRNTRPLIRATAPQTTIIAIFVVSESPVDEAAWEGCAVVGVAVESRMGLVFWAKFSGLLLLLCVVAVGVAAAETAKGVSVEKKPV